MRRWPRLGWLIASCFLATGGCAQTEAYRNGRPKVALTEPREAKVERKTTEDAPPATLAPAKWDSITTPPPPTPIAVSRPFEPMPPPPVAPAQFVAEPKDPLIRAIELLQQNKFEEAVRQLQAYDPRTQEFLQRTLPILMRITDKKYDSLAPTEIAVLSDQLSSLQTMLRQRAELAISKVAFCEWIKGYAVYKPVSDRHEFFAANSDRPGEMVQLYVEIKNFSSIAAPNGFEANLSASVEITDEKGQRKWSHRFRSEELKLVSRTRLNDYYHSFSFYLDPCLTPGLYHVTLTMVDETNPTAPRSAKAAIPLRITRAAN